MIGGFNISRLLKIELFLCIVFFFTPILLYGFQDGLADSISALAYSDIKMIYITLLNVCGGLYVLDGLNYRLRRYNILLGVCLMLVTVFPAIEYRLIHNTLAIIFFIGNSYIVTYHSDVISKQLKLIILTIITVSLLMFYFGLINLFFTESIGLYIVSFFMFMRFIRIMRIN